MAGPNGVQFEPVGDRQRFVVPPGGEQRLDVLGLEHQCRWVTVPGKIAGPLRGGEVHARRFGVAVPEVHDREQGLEMEDPQRARVPDQAEPEHDEPTRLDEVTAVRRRRRNEVQG